MNNIEKHRAFIESLEGEKGLPEEMHGFKFSAPFDLTDLVMFGERQMERLTETQCAQYWKERCRRAESRQIPDLKEKVKEFARDAMDMVRGYDESDSEFKAFCALCEPDKGGEVKP